MQPLSQYNVSQKDLAGIIVMTLIQFLNKRGVHQQTRTRKFPVIPTQARLIKMAKRLKGVS